MKSLRTILLASSFLFTQIAGATTVATSPSPTPPKKTTAPKTPSGFILTPASIEKQLGASNLPIKLELAKVHDAKDQVNVARGNLLPSLSLSGSIASGTGFFLSAIDFLLPFLMPSNWENYYTEKELFSSEKLSYKIIELNTYSSALSIYYNTISDHQLKEIYEQEYLDLQTVFETQKRNSAIGNIPTADLLLAQAQAQTAGIRASQLAEMNVAEIASIRNALNLPLSTKMNLSEVNMPESHWEYEPAASVVAQVNAVAPEILQFTYLTQAAVDQKWSKEFAWINGASVGSQVYAPGQNAGFSNMIGTGTVNLGFAIFPTVTIAERNIQELQIQKQELQNQNTQVVEAALGSLQMARQQLDLANQASEEMSKVYAIRLNNYNLGSETFTNVVLARNQWADASVSQVKAQLDLNQQRVTLFRALLADNFASIHGCLATSAPEPSPAPWKFGHFHGKNPVESHASLDVLCRSQQ